MAGEGVTWWVWAGVPWLGSVGVEGVGRPLGVFRVIERAGKESSHMESTGDENA